MKKTIALAFAVCTAVSTFSQKVDLDEKKVTVRFTQLPSNPFPKNFETYSVSLSANPRDLSGIGLAETFFTNNLVVAGYRKVEEGGHFNLYLTLHDYKSGKGETKTNKAKDRFGRETGGVTYSYEAGFEHMLTLLVRSQDNPKIEQRNWLEGTRKYVSKEFANTRDLNNYATSRQVGLDIAKKDQEDIINTMKSIRGYLASAYGYQETAEYATLMFLDSEKHPDYAQFLEAFNAAQKALEALLPHEPIDSAKVLARTSIEYFTKQKDTYDTSDKSGRKMKYACLFNLMTLHFWLENFDAASSSAQELIANDYDKKDGERMLEAITTTRKSLEVCNRTTRHFVIETPIAESTPSVTNSENGGQKQESVEVSYQTDSDERKLAQKEKSLSLTPNTVKYAGSITGTDGKEYPVIFLVENPRTAGLIFGYAGNVRYAVDLDNTYHVQRIDKSKVSQFSLDGRTFKVVSFRSANTLSLSGASKTIFEVIADLQTHAAYLAYSGDNEGVISNPPEYVVENKKEQSLTSLNSMKFALSFNKGISKTFDYCPAVVEDAKAGNFKRNHDEITRLVTMLNDCTK